MLVCEQLFKLVKFKIYKNILIQNSQKYYYTTGFIKIWFLTLIQC